MDLRILDFLFSCFFILRSSSCFRWTLRSDLPPPYIVICRSAEACNLLFRFSRFHGAGPWPPLFFLLCFVDTVWTHIPDIIVWRHFDHVFVLSFLSHHARACVFHHSLPATPLMSSRLNIHFAYGRV